MKCLYCHLSLMFPRERGSLCCQVCTTTECKVIYNFAQETDKPTLLTLISNYKSIDYYIMIPLEVMNGEMIMSEQPSPILAYQHTVTPEINGWRFLPKQLNQNLTPQNCIKKIQTYLTFS